MTRAQARTQAALKHQLNAINAVLTRFTNDRGAKPIRSQAELIAVMASHLEASSTPQHPTNSQSHNEVSIDTNDGTHDVAGDGL